MTETSEIRETASDGVAARARQLRQRRGWSAARLAERCAEVGAPQLTASVIANIESGRRDKQGRRRRHVTVEELVALATALQTSPLVLLGPPPGQEQWVEVPLHFESGEEAAKFLEAFGRIASSLPLAEAGTATDTLQVSSPASGQESRADG
jgi:transcriptional regulator with XRE-family HTH domain